MVGSDMAPLHLPSFESNELPLCGRATQDLEIVPDRWFKQADSLIQCWECASIAGIGTEEDNDD